MHRPTLLALFAAMLAVAGCGEPVADDHFANDVQARREAAPAPVTPAVPVKVGELGPNFDACAAIGTTRNLEAGGRLPVRSAPFDNAQETGAVAAGARFFVCTRSHDQKWFGIVFDESGALSPACGVAAPLTARRAYEGPCRSGWVATPFVKLIAGLDLPPPAA
jgi:hypothetical protein